jgi:hypothetical protein
MPTAFLLLISEGLRRSRSKMNKGTSPFPSMSTLPTTRRQAMPRHPNNDSQPPSQHLYFEEIDR